jgi:hypothetical protein
MSLNSRLVCMAPTVASATLPAVTGEGMRVLDRAEGRHGELVLRGGEPFEAICLDVDNGPAWTLGPGKTVWSAAADEAFRAVLGRVFATVEAVEVPVGRGAPDVVYVARYG